MKIALFLARGASAMLVIASSWGSQAVPTAFLRSSEVWVRGSGSTEERQITNDGTQKFLLVQSKGGGRLAFLRSSTVAMVDIVVMSMDGSLLKEIHFRPVAENAVGMRGVEHMEWISERRLVVSGSINPSTGEYAVLDAETGAEVKGNLTDGPNWVPSPDGEHAAYFGFIGHFTPDSERRPQLCLDDECGLGEPHGYPQDVHVEFSTSPEWSTDGSAVAILAENYDTHANSVIVRHPQGKSLNIPTPKGAEDNLGVNWDGDVLILSSSNGKWKLEPRASDFVQMNLK